MRNGLRSDVRRKRAIASDWGHWFFTGKMLKKVKEESRRMSAGRSFQGKGMRTKAQRQEITDV